jgi:ABC-type dipeptide/oligopeptide/nickel transport system permease component
MTLLEHVALPALTLGLSSAALIARLTRSAMLEVLNQDYIRTARAKGIGESRVVMRHSLRNAMIPILTIIGIDLGRMLAGTTVIEIVFSRPGVGHLLIEAMQARDYPQIQGAILFYITVIIVTNTLVDVLYTVVDPRIRFA